MPGEKPLSRRPGGLEGETTRRRLEVPLNETIPYECTCALPLWDTQLGTAESRDEDGVIQL